MVSLTNGRTVRPFFIFFFFNYFCLSVLTELYFSRASDSYDFRAVFVVMREVLVFIGLDDVVKMNFVWPSTLSISSN